MSHILIKTQSFVLQHPEIVIEPGVYPVIEQFNKAKWMSKDTAFRIQQGDKGLPVELNESEDDEDDLPVEEN